ncbi:MAG: hypothetical protein A2Y97_09540 [Nitrospirae bacterium RBG_13_39_12]|nr:MAG: hypothetical protein A2Y97_09540 [Nitrospirae bacterium RBG_13_39_12]
MDKFLSFGYKDITVPLAPIPSIAMLIIMKAKWYQREIENTLARAISYARLEDEHRKIINNIFEYLIIVLKRL